MSWLLTLLACSMAPEMPAPPPAETAPAVQPSTSRIDRVERDMQLLDLPGEVAFVELQHQDGGLLLERDFDGDGVLDTLRFANLGNGDQLAHLYLGADERADHRFVIRVAQDGGRVTLVFRRVRLEDLRALMGWS